MPTLLDLFIMELKPGCRISMDWELLSRFFPTFRIHTRGNEIERTEDYLYIRRKRYGTLMETDAHPYVTVDIYPRDWDPGMPPHRYFDGSLCMMSPTDWSDMFSIAYLVAKTAVWINKWLYWKKHGRWPGLSQD